MSIEGPQRPAKDFDLGFSGGGNRFLPQATSFSVENLPARLGSVQGGISITSFPIIFVYT